MLSKKYPKSFYGFGYFGFLRRLAADGVGRVLGSVGINVLQITELFITIMQKRSANDAMLCAKTDKTDIFLLRNNSIIGIDIRDVVCYNKLSFFIIK